MSISGAEQAGSKKKPLLETIPELKTGWHIDQAILHDSNRVVVIRFGRPGKQACKIIDDMLRSLQFKLINLAAIYFVDIDKVPDYNEIYDFGDDDDFAVMFFWQNKHIMIDFDSGDNNKLNFMVNNKEEIVDIVEVVYKNCRRGRVSCRSPHTYSK
ncbi:hypothetical protein QEN19_003975 [Hanseniaspora menglaensis]